MSTAAEVIATLRDRGVELQADGDRIRFRPVSAVSPELQDEMRRFKSEILTALRPPTSDAHQGPLTATGLAELERDWAAAWNRAQQGFASHGIEPTTETLTGAATLELWISDGGPPRPGMTVTDLRDWTREIYRGLGSARVGQDGRVVLRAMPDPSGKAS